MDKLEELKDRYFNRLEPSDEDVWWLIGEAQRARRLESQLTELICAVYEHANEGTELMEIAERIDATD